MKNLSNTIENMELNLYDNNLGKNPENLISFPEIIKYLPNNLKNLKLNLYNNALGANA